MELENFLGKITNGDCVEVMGKLPDNSINLVVTSCPYSVNINYDVYDDNTTIEQYLEFTEKWLAQVYRLLKDDGRVAINIPYEVNLKERGGRIFFVSEFYQIMKKVGFKFFGIVDLEEVSPHRSRTTAWGSWMSSSSPYIYNPKECVILGYKKHHVRQTKGQAQWDGVPTEITKEDGTTRTKMVYSEEDKKDFMELVFGQWKYFADTKPLTKATFSTDIPMKAMKILTYKNDIILDPFMGSGTSAVSAEILGRRWIGIELSPNYAQIATERVQAFIEQKKQQSLEFENPQV
jgi:site-specific DNA-methyltransferase (adenine-specific)